MSSPSQARYLAPIALVAAALAILIVWTSTLGDDGEQAGSSPAGQTTSTPTTSTTSTEESEGGSQAGAEEDSEGGSQASTYTVESGDNLSSIAQETGVSVERLLELNEDVDPQGLQSGDELTIRP